MKMGSHSSIRSVLTLAAVGWAALGVCQTRPDAVADARSKIDAGKVTEAEATLRSFLILNPSSADAHFLLGYTLFREEKAKESLDEFNAGAKLRRPTPEDLKIVASDYILAGDFGNADKWFTKVVAETPNDANARYLLGRTKFNEDNFADAIANFERAIALKPKYVEAENNIGLAWRELNNPEKAEAAFQTAIEWQGNSPVDEQPFLNLGSMLADQNKPERAASYLKKAAELAPRNPTVHEELSHLYILQQDLPRAQSEIEQAVALAPTVSSLHYKLGQLYRKEGKRAQAQKEFDICNKLSGTHSSNKTPNPLSLKAPDLH
jgi:Flp pilus assembly protein TadD